MRKPSTSITILVILLQLGPAHVVAQTHQLQMTNALGITAISTLNGILSDPSDESTRLVIDLIQESLIDWRIDEDTGMPELVGELAQSYGPLTEEGVANAYVFNLYSDVRWQDNVSLTAQDIVFTFDSVRNSSLRSPYKERLDAALAPSDPTGVGCQPSSGDALAAANLNKGFCPYFASNDSTLVVYSNGVSEEEFYEALIIPIVPKHIWKDVDQQFEIWSTDAGSTGQSADRVVGTGQYQFVSRTRYVDDCEVDLDPSRPPDVPDEDVRLQISSTYTAKKPAWQAFPEFILKIYACAQNDQDPILAYALSPSDRIDLALSEGAVNFHSITELRPPEYSGAFPPGSFEDPAFDFERVLIDNASFDARAVDARIIDRVQNDLIDFEAALPRP